jgi:pilus assembly protein TadC
MSWDLVRSAPWWSGPLLVGLAVAIWPSRRRTRRARRAAAVLAGPGAPVRADPVIRRWPKVVAAIGFRSRASPPLRLATDLLMELVAAGLRSGLSVVDALGCTASAGRGPGAQLPGGDSSAYLDQVVALLRLGVPAREAWAEPPAELEPLARALVLAELSGAPAARIVVRAASDARASARERVELGAARLGVRLVLPLGLAVLPGFVLLAVAPIVLGLAASVIGQAA